MLKNMLIYMIKKVKIYDKALAVLFSYLRDIKARNT